MSLKTLSLVLTLWTIARAGDGADPVAADLAVFRQRYVARGVTDPAAALRAAMRGSADDRLVDARRASVDLPAKKDPLGELRIERVLPALRDAAGTLFADVTVTIVAEESPNAMTPGGNRIFITDGLLRGINDAELTFTLAHELGHIVCRHRHRTVQTVEELSRLGLSPVEMMLALNMHSRICEAEADATAVRLLERAGLLCAGRANDTIFQFFAQHEVGADRVAGDLTRLEAELADAERTFADARTSASMDRLVRAREARDSCRAALDAVRPSGRTHPAHDARRACCAASRTEVDRRRLGATRSDPAQHPVVAYVFDAAPPVADNAPKLTVKR
jgi:hypothetical protein